MLPCFQPSSLPLSLTLIQARIPRWCPLRLVDLDHGDLVRVAPAVLVRAAEVRVARRG